MNLKRSKTWRSDRVAVLTGFINFDRTENAPYATTGEKNAAAYQMRTKKFYECARSKMAKAVVENFVKEYTSQPKLRKK